MSRLSSCPTDQSAVPVRAPRRPSQLQGYGTFADQSTFPVAILDLSYDGCRIRTVIGLLPKAKFQLSILGLAGIVNVEVRWSAGPEAGLKFDREELERSPQRPRAFERNQMIAGVAIRQQSRQPFKTQVLDLTPAGCKVEFVELPRLDETLWVRFDGLEAIEAKVRWVSGCVGGLQFARPIYAPVFELLLLRLAGEVQS